MSGLSWLVGRERLEDCYWVGSLDFNFLVEIKLGFPLTQTKLNFLHGSTATKTPAALLRFGRNVPRVFFVPMSSVQTADFARAWCPF